MSRNNEVTYETFCAGSSKTAIFNIKEKTNGHIQPADLTRYVATLKLFKFGCSDTILLNIDGEIDPHNIGRVVVHLKGQDTINLTEGIYTFQLTLSSPLQGKVYKKQENWYIQAKVGV